MKWLRSIACALLLTCVSAQDFVRPPLWLQELLRTRIGMNSGDVVEAVADAKPSVQVLSNHERGEIAIAGVTRLGVPLDFFLQSFRGMPTFKRGQQVLLIRVFSNPPRLRDLGSLQLSSNEINALRSCTPGACSVKLSAAMMEQIRRAAAPQDVTLRFKNALLDYLAQYLSKGNAALITYADKLPEVRNADELQGLLREADWLKDAAPPLYDCPQSFSGKPCPQVISFLYWSSAKFGLKPLLSITHVMIYRTQRDERQCVYIAFKQIYADHYIQSSLGVAVLVQESGSSGNPALWLVYLNRSRTDALGGWLGPIKRSIAEGRSANAMRQNLTALKHNQELRYALRGNARATSTPLR